MTLQCRGRDYNSTLLHEYSHPDLFYHDQYSRLTPPGKPLNKFGCIRSVGCSRVTRSERYTCGQCKSLLRNNRFVWILKRKLKKKNQKTTKDRYASHSLLQKRLIQTRYVSFFQSYVRYIQGWAQVGRFLISSWPWQETQVPVL